MTNRVSAAMSAMNTIVQSLLIAHAAPSFDIVAKAALISLLTGNMLKAYASWETGTTTVSTVRLYAAQAVEKSIRSGTSNLAAYYTRQAARVRQQMALWMANPVPPSPPPQSISFSYIFGSPLQLAKAINHDLL